MGGGQIRDLEDRYQLPGLLWDMALGFAKNCSNCPAFIANRPGA